MAFFLRLTFLLSIVTLLGCATTSPKVAAWEYKTVATSGQAWLSDSQLKKLGEEGWSLVSTPLVDNNKPIYIFKRPKSAK